MSIRKYGNEPAETEIRDEDNDLETLSTVKKQAQGGSGVSRESVGGVPSVPCGEVEFDGSEWDFRT